MPNAHLGVGEHLQGVADGVLPPLQQEAEGRVEADRGEVVRLRRAPLGPRRVLRAVGLAAGREVCAGQQDPRRLVHVVLVQHRAQPRLAEHNLPQ